MSSPNPGGRCAASKEVTEGGYEACAEGPKRNPAVTYGRLRTPTEDPPPRGGGVFKGAANVNKQQNEGTDGAG